MLGGDMIYAKLKRVSIILGFQLILGFNTI